MLNTRTSGPAILIACAALVVDADVAQAQESSRWERAADIEQDLGMVIKAVLLSRGSAIALDGSDNRVYVIDFRTGKTRDVASAGQGPNEYTAASDVGRAGGDTTFVVDKGLQRVLLLNEKGVAYQTITLARHFGQKRAFTLLGQVLHVSPNGSTLVLSLPKIGVTTRSFALSDSSYLVRAMVSGDVVRADTLAVFRSIPSAVVAGQPTSAEPYPSLDATGVLHMGGFVVARGHGFHVDIWNSNRDSVRVTVPFTPQRVTAEHRKSYSEQMRVLRARLERSLTPEVRERVGAMILGPLGEPETWPEFFPPFVHTGAVVADGRYFWLQGWVTIPATVTQYFVIDTQLRKATTVTFPFGSGVLSVLGNEMLVLAPGGGDVPRLQLFRSK